MIEFFNEDCMDVMSRYADNHFDLAITSPPYNVNINYKGQKLTTNTKYIGTKYNNYDDNMEMKDYYKFLDNVIRELNRVSKLVFFNIQMVSGNKSALFNLIGTYSQQIKEVIIWDKVNAQPAIQPQCLNSLFEFIIVFGDKPIMRKFTNSQFDRGTLDNIWRIKAVNNSYYGHKAMFPLKLTDKILRDFSKKGDIVLDCFSGLATTAISSYYAGCDFVGCEIDKDYFEKGKARYENETKQVGMF